MGIAKNKAPFVQVNNLWSDMHWPLTWTNDDTTQKIRFVDVLLTTKIVLPWSGRFGIDHIGWSQLTAVGFIHHCACPVTILDTAVYLMTRHQISVKGISLFLKKSTLLKVNKTWHGVRTHKYANYEWWTTSVCNLRYINYHGSHPCT